MRHSRCRPRLSTSLDRSRSPPRDTRATCTRGPSTPTATATHSPLQSCRCRKTATVWTTPTSTAATASRSPLTPASAARGCASLGALVHGASVGSAVVPLTFQLARPWRATLTANTDPIAPLHDLATDGAVSPSYSSTTALTATVDFDDDTTVDMSSDSRVALSVEPAECADVVSTLDQTLQGTPAVQLRETVREHVRNASRSSPPSRSARARRCSRRAPNWDGAVRVPRCEQSLHPQPSSGAVALSDGASVLRPLRALTVPATSSARSWLASSASRYATPTMAPVDGRAQPQLLCGVCGSLRVGRRHQSSDRIDDRHLGSRIRPPGGSVSACRRCHGHVGIATAHATASATTTVRLVDGAAPITALSASVSGLSSGTVIGVNGSTGSTVSASSLVLSYGGGQLSYSLSSLTNTIAGWYAGLSSAALRAARLLLERSTRRPRGRSASGTLTLYDNYPSAFDLHAQTVCGGGSVSASTEVKTNLRPDVYDIDLGATGSAVWDPGARGTLDVDVRVRSSCDWTFIGVFLYYHRASLTPVSTATPTDFTGQPSLPAGVWSDTAGQPRGPHLPAGTRRVRLCRQDRHARQRGLLRRCQRRVDRHGCVHRERRRGGASISSRRTGR